MQKGEQRGIILKSRIAQFTHCSLKQYIASMHLTLRRDLAASLLLTSVEVALDKQTYGEDMPKLIVAVEQGYSPLHSIVIIVSNVGINGTVQEWMAQSVQFSLLITIKLLPRATAS